MSAETLSDRQRRFAQLVVDGTAAGRAYEKAGYSARGGAADSSACKLLRIPKVYDYVQELRRKAAERSEMKRWEMIEWLTRAIRLPVGQIDERSDLAQEVQTDEFPDGGCRMKVKMVGKLEAAKQLATLLGWNEPEKIQIDASERFGDLLKKMRAGK